MTKDQINMIIDDRLLSSIDGINSALSNSITVFIGIFTLFAVYAGVSLFKRDKIIKEVLIEVNKELDEVKQNIVKRADEKTNNHIKNSIQRYKEESQKEEYYRNMMFKDLSTMLANDLHFNDSNNLKEVFNLHAQRIGVITQLTSGDEKETVSALKKLSTGTYDLTKMEAFKEYVKILAGKTDMDLSSVLYKFKST